MEDGICVDYGAKLQIDHTIDNATVNEKYYLHSHDYIEILLFVSGDSRFNIEGTIYQLKPYDMMVVPSNDLHRVIHLSSAKYERYVIQFTNDFFSKNNCPQYAEVFKKENGRLQNYIPAEIVMKSGMDKVVKKATEYQLMGESPVANAAMVELIYLIKKNTGSATFEGENSQYVQRAIEYIGKNLTEELNIENISRACNVSAPHLRREFKKHMHTTIPKYVTYKRLILAKELCRMGKSMLEASQEVGFASYSSFYRAYVSEYKKTPRADIRK